MVLVDFLFNSFQCVLRHVKKGKRVKFVGRTLFKGRNGITIGDDCVIRSGARANPLFGMTRTCLAAQGGELVIGDHVGISNSCLHASTRIEIGKNSLIGNSCTIIDSDFHPLDFEKRLAGKPGVSRPVFIGENVWIGCNAIILKGSRIGNGAVIGAGSVVCGEVPENELWAGNPARFIRRLK